MRGRVLGGRFRLDDCVAEGGQGQVWRALDLSTGEAAAVKLSQDGPARDLREGDVLAQLRFPGVVRLFGHGVDDGRRWLAMEFVEGADFPGDPPGEPEALAVALLEILARVHRAGVLHRDLKPGNVRVTPSGAVVLLDFGLAEVDWRQRFRRHAVAGSVRYLPPEAFLGQAPTERYDLYAAGWMLFTAVAGVEPFEGLDAVPKAIRAKRDLDPPSLAERVPDAPPRLVAVVDAMLQRDPEDRPASAAESLALLRGGWGPSEPLPALDGADGPLDIKALQALFIGLERVLHLVSDPAEELLLRTGGEPDRVRDELDAWVRARLAVREGDRFRLNRAQVNQLRAAQGRPLSVEPAREGLDAVSEDAQAVARWLGPAWPNSAAPLLSAVSGLPPARVSRALAELEVAGLAEQTTTGAWRDRSGARRPRDVDAHRALARALPPGTPGRMRHLIVLDEPHALAAEALAFARRLAEQGRLGEALATLTDALTRLHDAGVPLAPLHREVALCALASEDLPTLSRALETLERMGARDALLRQLRAARMVLERDPVGARAVVEGMSAFSDDALECWRQAVRVYAARQRSLEEEERLLGELERWSREQGGPLARAKVLGWLGQLRYRQERFEEAVRFHDRAQVGRGREDARISVLLMAASAAMEAGGLEGARQRARAARERAARCRHALYEARAEWLLRCIDYRDGETLKPDRELVAAADALGGALAGLVRATEGAIAWRRGDLTLAAQLTAEAQAPLKSIPNALVLVQALHAHAVGAPPPGCRERLMDWAEHSNHPMLAVQVLGLLGGVVGPADRAEARALLQVHVGSLEGVSPTVRREVLSIQEAVGLLERGSAHF
ncbi:MAG: serine/threonine protein kinase [Alphaproteobacteria bacterium]|nr:serine/threonine protein kinase [Alphaproteobacteria bacterium]